MAVPFTLQRNRRANLSLPFACGSVSQWFASRRRRRRRVTRNSLWNVFGLSAGAGVGAALSLVVGVDEDATARVLDSFFGAAHDDLLGTLLRLNLRRLVSDLTITGQ